MPFTPACAQDARAFVQSLQYWLGGNAANLEGLLLNVAQMYVPALKGVDFSVAEPSALPGRWHLAPSRTQCATLSCALGHVGNTSCPCMATHACTWRPLL